MKTRVHEFGLYALLICAGLLLSGCSAMPLVSWGLHDLDVEVRDAAGEPVANARVQVSGDAESLTDGQGRASFSHLRSGLHVLSISSTTQTPRQIRVQLPFAQRVLKVALPDTRLATPSRATVIAELP